MVDTIRFNKKPYKKVRMKIKAKTNFNDLLSAVSLLTIEGNGIESDYIMYAVLELLNNSLRAHRERKIEKDIIAEFKINGNSLIIRIQDWGGGFNPQDLPYDIEADPEFIDMHGNSFQKYREENDYKRFGIGLLVCKKTFSQFNLYFIDNELKTVPWESGRTAGTCIELAVGE